MNATVRYRDPSGAVYAEECADRWAETIGLRRAREGATSVLITWSTGETMRLGRVDPELATDELCAAVDYHYSAT